MIIEIKSRWDDHIIYSGEAATLKDLVATAVKGHADLSDAYLRCADQSGAYLRCAYLRGAYLRGADLSGADLSGAYLRCADLRCADLSGAYLSDADLCGADLSGAKNIWQSHAILSEILWRAAEGNAAREQLAAWIGRKVGWCWAQWLACEHAEKAWALSILAPLVQDGDSAPEALRAMKTTETQSKETTLSPRRRRRRRRRLRRNDGRACGRSALPSGSPRRRRRGTN